MAASAAPTMPSAGKGPQPRISAGDRARWKASPMAMAKAGTIMLPAPRETLAKRFISQTKIEPPNMTPP